MPQRPIGRNRSHGVERKINIVTHLLFFTCFYLYIWLRINPRFLYYKNPELFLLDSEFFKNFLLYPGGIVDYISKFLLEFYYFNWPGALIISLFTFMVCFEYQRFLKNITAQGGRVLFFIPAAIILIIYNRYSSLSLAGLLLVLLCANIYIKIKPKSHLLKVTLYLALSIFVYYVAMYSYWLFSAMCAIYEIIKNKKIILGWLYLGVQLLISCISAEYILYLKGKGAFYFLFPFFYPVNLWVRLLIFAISVFILFIFLLKVRLKPSVFVLPLVAIVFLQFWAEPISNKILYSFFLLAPVVQLTIQKWNKVLISSLAILSFSVAIFTFDKDARTLLKINYFSLNRMWESVLKEAKRIPLRLYEKNKILYEIVFKALYHSGRLPYEEFDYPAFLLLNFAYPRPGAAHIFLRYTNATEISDTCFSLGLINHSELMAFLALEIANEPVRPMQQLVMVYILKGDKKTAQILLNRLEKSLLYKKWAQKYSLILENNALLEREPYLAQAKSRMIKADDPKDGELLIRIAYKYDYEGVFKRLLSENKNNRMAFEYLMAYYLLMGQTEKIIENLDQIDNFGYLDIPLNYQEAILINMFKTQDFNPDLKGRKINPLLEEKYRYFNEVYRKYNHDKIATYNALRQEHSNSYFLYYIMLTKRR